jgi:hypothetical protein
MCPFSIVAVRVILHVMRLNVTIVWNGTEGGDRLLLVAVVVGGGLCLHRMSQEKNTDSHSF